MKIRVLSDLHLEFTQYRETLPSIREDLVVLAGDIGMGSGGVKWALEAIPDRPVVYVLGNHEFYQNDWLTLVDKCKALAEASNVHVLENDSVEIGGLRILGCSLWTDFRSELMSRKDAMHEATWALNDYALIAKGDRRLQAVDTLARCRESRWWLRRQISASTQATLVVTHHAPTFETSNPQYLRSRLNPAFHSSFHRLIRSPVLAWIHGHTHYSCTKRVNGIPVVSNQRGYPREPTAFDWDFVFDLDAAQSRLKVNHGSCPSRSSTPVKP